MKKIFAVLLLLFASSASSLPVAIDTCILAGTCSYGGISNAVVIDGTPVWVHNLFDSRSGSMEQKVLMEYQLGASSHIDNVGYDWDADQTLPLQTTPITGQVWLEANTSYDLTNPLHALTLYFDQATPSGAPANIWHDSSFPPADEQHLLITTGGLLSGTGETYMDCCDWPTTPPSPFSSTASSNPSLFDSTGNVTLSCLAEGCGAGAMLSLLGMQYTQAGNNALLTINPAEARSLLYFTAGGYEGYTHTTYSMSAVPLPSAVWLFGSGIIGLVGIAKHKKS